MSTRAREIAELGQKLTVDASGNIDVAGTGTFDGLTVDGVTGEGINIGDVGNSVDRLIRFENSSGTAKAAIGTIQEATYGRKTLAFYTNNAGDDTTDIDLTKPRLAISRGGSISFYEDTGTTAKFFWDASAEELIVGSSSGAGGAGLTITSSSGDAIGYILARGGNSLTTQHRYLNKSSGGSNTGGAVGHIGDIGLILTASSTSIDGAQDVVIDSSGNVGIGTSSPSELLSLEGVVSSNTDAPYLALSAGRPTDRYSAIGLNKGNTSNQVGLSFYTTNNLDTPTEKMRIDSSGNLLVGKTALNTNTAGLQLESDGYLSACRDGGNVVLVNRKGVSDGALVTFQKDGATVGSIGTLTGDMYLGTGDTGLYFLDSSDAIIPANPSSPSVSNGIVNLGQPSYRFKDLYLSGTVNAATLNVNGGTIKLDGNYPVGTNNVALGNAALDDTSLSGDYNTAIGNDALSSNTSGSGNDGIGAAALLANTSGAENTALGGSSATYAALRFNTTGSNNTAVGGGALASNISASNNTAVGYQAGYANTTGALTAFGSNALKANTTGDYNHAFGESALLSNTTGTANVAVGGSSLRTNTTGAYNVAIGDSALRSNTTASNNTAVGYQAGNTNTTGLYNTLIGSQTGFYLTTGSGNTFIGGPSYTSCGRYVTTGSKNTIIGGYDGNQGGLDIRTSSNNIVLSDGDGNPRQYINSSGYVGFATYTPVGRVTVAGGTGVNPVGGSLSNFAITTFGGYGGGISLIDSSVPSGTGYGIWVDDAGNDFNIARGTTSSSVYGGVYINDSAGSWSARSDERDKINLEPISDAASKVLSLRAVIGEYVWAEGVRHPFLIAQDVQAVLPEAVSVANKSAPEEDQRLGVSYTDTIPLLTAALQEALIKIETLEAKVNALENP